MKLLILEEQTWKVVAVVKERSSKCQCDALEFLAELEKKYGSSAKGMKVLFRRYARSGQQELTSASFHHADRKQGILEFIKGKLRIFCFEGEGEQLIVLTTGILKKTQKANKQELAKAIKAKSEYLEAKNTGRIEYISMDDELVREIRDEWDKTGS